MARTSLVLAGEVAARRIAAERALKATRLAAPVPLCLRRVLKHHQPLLLRAEPHDVVELARGRARVRVRVRVRVRARVRVRVR